MYKRYAPEIKEKVLKIYRETKNIDFCVDYAKITKQTLYSWVNFENKKILRNQFNQKYKYIIFSVSDDQFCIQLKSNTVKKIHNHQQQLQYLVDDFIGKIKGLTNEMP